MNVFTRIGLELKQLAKDLPEATDKNLKAFGDAMAEYLMEHWPRDTGQSAMGWLCVPLGPGRVRVMNVFDYTSFVHAKGDESKTPIYIEMIRRAAEYAAEKVPIEANLKDMTAAYISKGLKYKPTNALWLEVSGRKPANYAASVPMEVTVDVPGGLAGTFTVVPRR